MERETYEVKRKDYHALMVALAELLEKFKDYTPERQNELDQIIRKACQNAEDLPQGKELFLIARSYIMHRYTELNEYRARRADAENTFLAALPDIIDKLAAPSDNSCAEIAKVIEVYDKKDNYQLLVANIITLFTAL